MTLYLLQLKEEKTKQGERESEGIQGKNKGERRKL